MIGRALKHIRHLKQMANLCSGRIHSHGGLRPGLSITRARSKSKDHQSGNKKLREKYDALANFDARFVVSKVRVPVGQEGIKRVTHFAD